MTTDALWVGTTPDLPPARFICGACHLRVDVKLRETLESESAFAVENTEEGLARLFTHAREVHGLGVVPALASW